jgi:hypothetical protein
MQDQPIPDLNAEHNDREREVLYLLCGMRDVQPLWSVDDLGREIESHDHAEVAVNGLLRAGLADEPANGFVCASRAGVRVVEMVGFVV